MSESVALCTHVKTDGVRCGSPAVSGTALCYHHSAVKTALGKAQTMNEYGTCPLPFVFPEDRASMQINFFLLLGALNEGRIDLRTYHSFLSLLRAMARNLGKSGSLVEDREQGSELKAQEGSEKVTGGQAHKRSAANQSDGKNLNAAPTKLEPEACFLNSVSAGDGSTVDPFELGWMGEREARRMSGGRGKGARRVA